MAWLPISQAVPQYMDSNGDPYSGAVLKFYENGTSTNTNMATDSTGGTQIADVILDSNGNPSNGGSVFIPHLDQEYKIALYPTEAAADADTGAIWTVDNISPADLTDTDTDVLVTVSSNDTTAGYLNGKLVAGDNITLTENNDGGNETLTIAAQQTNTNATPQASTSGTSIDFTGIPTWVKKITVMFVGVSTSGTDAYYIQIGDSGGVETTGYAASGSILDTGPTYSRTSSSAGFVIASASASNAFQDAVTLTLENETSFTWVASGTLQSGTATYTSSGSKSLSATLDRVRITTVSGTDTFMAGEVNILYS